MTIWKRCGRKRLPIFWHNSWICTRRLRKLENFRVVTLCELVIRYQRFRETYCLHLQGGTHTWRWSQYVSPKRWYLPTSPHGVTTYNIVIFNLKSHIENFSWDSRPPGRDSKPWHTKDETEVVAIEKAASSLNSRTVALHVVHQGMYARRRKPSSQWDDTWQLITTSYHSMS
jgi:hypothetical protein